MNPYLLKSLEFGPIVLERIVGQIPQSRFDERTSNDRFTLREAVAHLVDFEPIFRGRMEQANSNPGCAVIVMDEGQMAIDHDYASQDVHRNLEMFVSQRASTAAFLRTLSPSDFQKTMVHPQLGPLAIEDVANLLLGHDLYHLEHASELMRSTNA